MSAPTTDPEVFYDESRKLYYRYDQQTQANVWVDPDTGAMLRQSSDVEREADTAYERHVRDRGLSESTGTGTISTDTTGQLESKMKGLALDHDTKPEPAYSHASPKSPETPSMPILYEPKNAITDIDLFNQGHEARSKVLGTPKKGIQEDLDPNYMIQSSPRKFFTVGRVIKVLWPELGGYTVDNMTIVTSARFKNVNMFAKIRWFVVVKEGYESCTCLPISTYGGKGLSETKKPKWQHSIIYTGKEEPSPLPSEQPSQGQRGMLTSIKVTPHRKTDTMHPMSRLHYDKMYTIEHNVKVYNFGIVRSDYIEVLTEQWKGILNWSAQSKKAQPTSQGNSHGSSSQTTQSGTTGQNASYGSTGLGTVVEEQQRYIDYGQVSYAFHPNEVSLDGGQLVLQVGDRLGITEFPFEGWARAYNYNTTKFGLVPLSYITLDSQF